MEMLLLLKFHLHETPYDQKLDSDECECVFGAIFISPGNGCYLLFALAKSMPEPSRPLLKKERNVLMPY